MQKYAVTLEAFPICIHMHLYAQNMHIYVVASLSATGNGQRPAAGAGARLGAGCPDPYGPVRAADRDLTRPGPAA